MAKTTNRDVMLVLRDNGFIVESVERFNRFAGKFGVRQDFLGFADLLAFPGGMSCAEKSEAGSFITLVQNTSRSNMSSRVKKICESELARSWCTIACGRIVVIGTEKVDRFKKFSIVEIAWTSPWTSEGGSAVLIPYGESDICKAMIPARKLFIPKTSRKPF